MDFLKNVCHNSDELQYLNDSLQKIINILPELLMVFKGKSHIMNIKLYNIKYKTVYLVLYTITGFLQHLV